VLQAEALTNKGDTEDPYTAAEVAEKFIDITTPHLGPDRASALAQAVLTLDQAATLSHLLELGSPA
jgi:hypothetical protein